MKRPVPILDLSPEIEQLWDQLHEAVVGVMRSGRFILGAQVEAFEDEAARYLGVKHAIGCNSGTDALMIGLRSAGVGWGDEVITTSFTFVATAEAIKNVGAVPVFVDIDPETFNIDPAAIEGAVTPRTKAIIPVHLFGRGAEMDAINAVADRHHLTVVEDAAQAFGGRYHGNKMLGTIGHAGAFSFFPSKNLGGFGDGGMIVTDDDGIARLARMLRVHGSQERYHHEMPGYNSRLDEIQAAILRVKLPHVDAWNQGRRRVADRYDELLADLAWLKTPTRTQDGDHVFHQYTVRIMGCSRDEVQRRLGAAGISTMVYYPQPVHRMPAYQNPGSAPGSAPGSGSLELPCTDEAAERVLSLPIGPMLDDSTLERVADALHGLNNVNSSKHSQSIG